MADSTLTYDKLLLEGPFKTFNNLTLASGENVVAGEVVAYNTSTDKVESYDSGGSNGVNEFYGIAVEAVDASTGDKNISVYIGGTFGIAGLTFGTSGDSATQAFINKARELGCILKTAVKEDGS